MSDLSIGLKSAQHSRRADATRGRPAHGPIPRGQRARERVLRAALEVLTEHGLPGFTIEAVAQQAGASKATVYRHWRSQATLLVDAMDLSFQPFPDPAIGDLRSDLIELVSRGETLLRGKSFPRLMAAFVDAAEHDPALSSLHADLTERRREPIRRVLAKARQLREISAATDLELAVDLLASPLFYRRFIAHRTFPPHYATAIVDHVLTAIGYTSLDSHDHARRSSPQTRRSSLFTRRTTI